jgi:hypothetical protein
MNQLVEDYFDRLIAGAELLGDPDIYPGTCSEIREPDNSAILIVVDSVECVIATLHKASVKIIVSSPAENRVSHANMAYAVKELVEGVLPSQADFIVGGWVTKSNQTHTSDEGRWLTSIEGIFGFEDYGLPEN